MFCTQVKLLTRAYFAFYFYLIYMCYKCILLLDDVDDVDDIDVGVRWEMGDGGFRDVFRESFFVHSFIHSFVRSLVFLSYEVTFFKLAGVASLRVSCQ